MLTVIKYINKKTNSKTMDKKGSFGDFIAAYGWAIAIIIVAGIGMLYFGLLKDSGTIKERCEFPKHVICSEAPKGISSKGTIALTLTNNLGYPVTEVTAFSSGNANCKSGSISSETWDDTTTTTLILKECTLQEGIRFSDDVTLQYIDNEGTKQEIIGQIDGTSE